MRPPGDHRRFGRDRSPDCTGATVGPGLAEPPPAVWAALGLTPEAEVHGGHQSKVFLASGRAGRLIVKLNQATDGHAVARHRAEIVAQLAELDPAVVGPVALASKLVTEVDSWQVTCYPPVEGARPDIDDRDDVAAMATTLAGLHRSMAMLIAPELPAVAALQGASDHRLDRGQIIHGDYAAANLILTPAGLRIIDFDDCGRGSVEFEIGNSLYMVLFDAWNRGDGDRYDRFRSWFVEAYRDTTPCPVEDSLLDTAIEVRLAALGRWLAAPATAPPGIRTATPEWRARLRSFVDQISP